MMIEAIMDMIMLDNVMGYSELLIENDWRVNDDGCWSYALNKICSHHFHQVVRIAGLTIGFVALVGLAVSAALLDSPAQGRYFDKKQD